MKRKLNNSTGGANSGDLPKQKERHIVSWSQEEDDILREQIRLHGTENWGIIASKFKDKSTRQCRRRWYTYLNSDFKKGGWSPEEDMLLCEAQKIFGNRWTEIAKVVSGRTDNAVKNRFNTLSKKRAKFAKENNTTSYINLNNKRVIFPNELNADGGSGNAAPLKEIRTHFSSNTDNQETSAAAFGDTGHPVTPPFVVLAQKETSIDGSENDKTQGTFIKKGDPKVLALMQQAELLSSLATKVNSEKTSQNLGSPWIALQKFQKQNEENDLLISENPYDDIQLEKLKVLVEDLRSSNEESIPSWREPDTYESSPATSEYSSGSTVMSNVSGNKTEEYRAEICLLDQETGLGLELDQLDDRHCLADGNGICRTTSTNEVNMFNYTDTKYSSPPHVTPLFRALAAAIPSPKFSESEKHFLMKTLGMESTSPSLITNPSQPPPCKRSLLHCL